MQYGLIGEHLSHSYSREIHQSIADYQYELCEIAPTQLSDFMTKRDFKAINVTIPYKQSVIPYLDNISDNAKSIGAVNTVVNRGGKLFGYNTDFYGMRDLILSNGIDIKNKKVLILGTGGTSKTARAVATSLKARAIINVSRKGSDTAITYEEAVLRHRDAGVIINTTPVGMYPDTDNCPIDLSYFDNLCGVADVIYHPLRTNLVLNAQKKGINTCGGLYMLAAQAVYACEKFIDKKFDNRIIKKAYDSVLNEKRNLVLIGMPSAGKTTVGKQLSKLTGKTFVDTDKEIVSFIGMSISEFFATHTEAEFRDIESKVIRDLSDKSGLIIATGGGAVLRDINQKNLKHNGTVIMLDRALDNLIFTADRPLSSDKNALKKLYDERYDIYKDAADVIVDANTTVYNTANIIKRLLSI